MRPPLDLTGLSAAALRALLPRIGGTPLVAHGRLLLKLEGENPGGSMKDRVALHVIRTLEAEGRLTPGAALVDSTSGNFGVAMAWVTRALGYRFVAVSDPRLTEENRARLLALGAEVEVVSERDETGGYLLTRIRRAREIADAKGAILVNQYENRANPDAHRLSTGPELLADTRALAAVFVPASTGGTLAGVAEFLREASPRTRVFAVDSPGSALFGGTPGPRVINGLGNSNPSPFLHPELYDGVHEVGPAEAIEWCHRLRDAGVEVGGSSGAAAAAAARWLRGRRVRGGVVAICPDHGSFYRASIFDAGWLAGQGLSAGPGQPPELRSAPAAAPA